MPTVLIVSASPLDQDRLRLNAEFRDIRHALQQSRNRDDWVIESNEAVTVDDLRRALLDFRPTIVHFSGHGGGLDGLCFENTEGRTNSADAESLAKLFHHFKDDLKCIVLNACYSKIQGDVIRQEIDYVVGMSSAVDDKSAIKFAVAFYDAVFAGTDFRTAFDLGCTALDLNNLPDAGVPIFMTGPHLELTELHYSAISQKSRGSSIHTSTHLLANMSGSMLHGYVERDSKVYEELIEILSDGNEHAITLEIEQVTDHTDMPLIKRVLSRTWICSQSQNPNT